MEKLKCFLNNELISCSRNGLLMHPSSDFSRALRGPDHRNPLGVGPQGRRKVGEGGDEGRPTLACKVNTNNMRNSRINTN